MVRLTLPVDNFLKLENRHTGEILRMRRVRDSGGQTVLAIDGSLPPRASGPPLHVHFHLREEGIVKAGSLGAQIGNEKIVVPAGGTFKLVAKIVQNPTLCRRYELVWCFRWCDPYQGVLLPCFSSLHRERNLRAKEPPEGTKAYNYNRECVEDACSCEHCRRSELTSAPLQGKNSILGGQIL
jgi:hypothetical protein